MRAVVVIALLSLAGSAHADPGTDCLNGLETATTSLGLPRGIENGLTAKLDAAQSSVAAGNPMPALGQLGAFTQQVGALPPKTLSPPNVASLKAGAGACTSTLIGQLGADGPRSLAVFQVTLSSVDDGSEGYAVSAYEIAANSYLLETRFSGGLVLRGTVDIDGGSVRFGFPAAGAMVTKDAVIPGLAEVPAAKRIMAVVTAHLSNVQAHYEDLRSLLIRTALPDRAKWPFMHDAPAQGEAPKSCEEMEEYLADKWASGRCYCDVVTHQCWCEDGGGERLKYDIRTESCEREFMGRVYEATRPIEPEQYGAPAGLARGGDVFGKVCYDPAHQDFKCSAGAPQQWNFCVFDTCTVVDFMDCCLEHDRAFFCGGTFGEFQGANTALMACVSGAVTSAYLEWHRQYYNEWWKWITLPITEAIAAVEWLTMVQLACSLFSNTGSFAGFMCPTILNGFGIASAIMSAANYFGDINGEDGWLASDRCAADPEECEIYQMRKQTCLCGGNKPVPLCGTDGCVINDCSLGVPERLERDAFVDGCGFDETDLYCQWACKTCVELGGGGQTTTPKLAISANGSGYDAVALPAEGAVLKRDQTIDAEWVAYRTDPATGRMVKDTEGWCEQHGSKPCGINCLPQGLPPSVAIGNRDLVFQLGQDQLEAAVSGGVGLDELELRPPYVVPRPPLFPALPSAIGGVGGPAQRPLAYDEPWQAAGPGITLGSAQGMATARLTAPAGSRVFCRTDGVVPVAGDGVSFDCTGKDQVFTKATHLTYQVVRAGFVPYLGDLLLDVK